jgi:hypothetical protein
MGRIKYSPESLRRMKRFKLWELSVVCPTCHAPIGKQCRTLQGITFPTGTVVTTVHVDRWWKNPRKAPQ